MGRKKSNKSAVVSVDADLVIGKPVDATEVVSLADETTPTAKTKGDKVVVAHGVAGTNAELPSEWVNPSDVLVEFDARTVPAHNQAEIDRDFAINLHIYGQKQPAIAYRDPVDDRLLLVTGRTRRRAVMLLNQGFEAIDPRTGEQATFHDADRKLWVAIDAPRSKEDAFVNDLVTQIKTNPLTPVQEAYAVKKLTESFGWTLTDAASLFGYNNTNRQAKLLSLLSLEEAVIESVHAGNMSLDAAVATKDLTPENRTKVVAKATSEDGKVDGGLIRELLRDIYSAGDEEVKKATGRDTDEDEGGEDDASAGKKTGRPAGPSLARNVAKFKAFAEAIISDEEGDFGEPTKLLLGRMLEWFAGSKGDTSLKNAIRENIRTK